MKKVFVTSKSDTKMMQWEIGINKLGGKVIYNKSLFEKMKLMFHYNGWRNNQLELWIVYRYLNDNPSLFNNIKTIIYDLLVVVMVKLFSVNLLWICHNLDQETRRYFKNISLVRRRLISQYANKILVTDPLLVDHAHRYLPGNSYKKVDWTCFGHINSYGEHKSWGNKTENIVKYEISKFVNLHRKNAKLLGKKSLIGLCLGRPGKKYIHYNLAGDLIKVSADTKYHIGLIVAVNINKVQDLEQYNSIKLLKDLNNVLLYEREIGFDECEMKDYYDFMWRVYDDWSVPISLYIAASNSIPTLTKRHGFLPELIDKYELGSVISPDWSNVDLCFKNLLSFNNSVGKEFLSERGWSKGSTKIF